MNIEQLLKFWLFCFLQVQMVTFGAVFFPNVGGFIWRLLETLYLFYLATVPHAAILIDFLAPIFNYLYKNAYEM